MRDTIDLLEAIGRDASLRHASADELAGMLRQAQASPHLTMAAAAGDKALLSGEFGHKVMHMPQVSQFPGHDEDQDEHDHDRDHDHDDRRDEREGEHAAHGSLPQ